MATQLGEVYDVSQGNIAAVSTLWDDFGVITVSQDRSIRVWLKRSTGQYWPSVCHFLNAPCTSLHVNKHHRAVFAGIETGTISYYKLSDDLNVLESVQTFNAHSSAAVVQCHFCPLRNWILSIGGEGNFVWSELNGNKLGNYILPSKPRCFQFDSESGFIFYGDDSGRVIILRLRPESKIDPVITLEGHQGPISCLYWDSSAQKLYSSSSKENRVISWDIGGKQGHFIELNGHSKPVQLIFTHQNSLFTIDSVGNLIKWDLTKKRKKCAEWTESDSCQACNDPFFWNVKQMWTEKKIGVRQHHCRSCGKALCEKCSKLRTTIPEQGFEFIPVRCCLGCYESITDSDRIPFATSHQLPTDVVLGDIDFTTKRLTILNRAKKILLFDLAAFL